LYRSVAYFALKLMPSDPDTSLAQDRGREKLES
jgi:hypothetical protein